MSVKPVVSSVVDGVLAAGGTNCCMSALWGALLTGISSFFFSFSDHLERQQHVGDHPHAGGAVHETGRRQVRHDEGQSIVSVVEVPRTLMKHYAGVRLLSMLERQLQFAVYVSFSFSPCGRSFGARSTR